ncbi:MAG: UDP-glucose 4-epimerase GalE [Bacteroidota bacterium]
MLSKHGYHTMVLDNLSYGHEEFVTSGVFIIGDLAQKELIDRLLSSYKIKAVMHFSAFAYVGESVENPSKYYHNNVINTINLLDAMVRNDVKNFIFSSTCATFGEPMYYPVDEKHPQKPISPYGRTKLMIEQILKDYEQAYDLKHVILRYFNAAGADPEGDIGEDHNPETHLIPLVLDAAAGLRKEIKVFGNDYETKDGTCIRDYIHVNDLAEAHMLAMEWMLENNASNDFNLGNGDGFSVQDIIKVAAEVTGLPINSKVVERREGDPARIVGSSEKARNVLGWEPQYNDIKSIVETAWKWHIKKNELKVEQVENAVI